MAGGMADGTGAVGGGIRGAGRGAGEWRGQSVTVCAPTSLLAVIGWVGVAAEEFFGVVGVVDVGGCGAVGPGQPAGVGDFGLVVAVGDEIVVGWAGEEQFV